MDRSEALQDFLDSAFAAFGQCMTDARSRNSVAELFSRLELPAATRVTGGKRLPVCGRFLDAALERNVGNPVLSVLVARFRAIEPRLEWRQRPTADQSASENFSDSHANAMIVGPGGLENRQDAWLGLTLMAPHVRYPDHNHAPEETYLVISGGEFRQADGEWFSPGVGGSFYNPPNVKHAMRSLESPLLAFWALLPDQTRQ